MRRLFVALFIAVVAGGVTCARQPASAEMQAAADRKCKGDADCPSHFCDRGVCAAPSGVYGRQCTAAPRTREGLRDPMLHVCGAYLCLDGRCRSCQSDAECRSELGSPRCYKLEGEPGRRCGNPAG